MNNEQPLVEVNSNLCFVFGSTDNLPTSEHESFSSSLIWEIRIL